jgi:hypothetical protein
MYLQKVIRRKTYLRIWIRTKMSRIRNTGKVITKICVADPYPGCGASLTPESGIRYRFFPDPGSRILNPYFWGKKFFNSLKTDPNFFLQHFKNKIIFNFVKFMATKKVMTKKFFRPSLSLLFLDLGTGILDPGSEIRYG